VPLLANPDREWKRAAFSQYPRRNQSVMGYSLRTDRHRYTEWIEKQSGDVLARELYDHSSGPVVAKNLVSEPDHARTVAELSNLLSKGQGWQQIRQTL
jgi:iduronate 2-sulfatase